MAVSRRAFFKTTAMAGGAACLAHAPSFLIANPIGLKPGVQLWSVREEIKTDLPGTLRKLAAIGYQEIELFETPKAPREFRKIVEDAGLKCVSGHFELKDLKDPAVLAAAHELGLSYMILVFPVLRSHQEMNLATADFKDLVPLYEKITLDDYQWNGEQLNQIGANLKRQGMRAGYHNHAIDLKPLGNTHGFDTLIQSTDPKLVCFEMDCGHIIHAGQDPVAYLKKYPARIELLHIKDLVPGYGISTTLDTEDKDTNAEIGAGSIDWKKVFAAARQGHVKHYFVEHEGKMAHPPLEALRISYDYLQKLDVD